MTDLVIAQYADIKAIANAIRSKTGQTERMSVPQMAGNIIGISDVGSGGTISDEQIEQAVSDYLTKNPLITAQSEAPEDITTLWIDTDDNSANSGGNVDFQVGETLKLENGVLSVNTTDSVEQDNTLPITSAGVFATVGNIEALLKTI